jgi:cytochrome P450
MHKVPSKIPSATWWENLAFNLGYLVPIALQGTFTRSRFWVGFWSRFHPDPAGVRFLQRLRARHRSDIIYVRMMTARALVISDRELVRQVLEDSPAHFIPARAKRDGMRHFQPQAVTISRAAEWEVRRRFNEDVLDYGRLHRFCDRFLTVIREEIAPAHGRAPALLSWDSYDRMFARLTRRIIFGDAARDDDQLTAALRTLMRAANRPRSAPDSQRLAAFQRQLRHYFRAPAAGSLAQLCVATPAMPADDVAGQIPHWMFAMWETLTTNTIRALALILAHPAAERRVRRELSQANLASAADVARLAYLGGCIHEAMRLWPTTPMIVREAAVQTLYAGEAIPAGTTLIIHNGLNHRDSQRDPYADWFAPERWADGTPNSLYNHLSSGTQICAGYNLAIFLAQAVLASVLSQRRLALVHPQLSPDRPLPHALDYFRVRFEPQAATAATTPADRSR